MRNSHTKDVCVCGGEESGSLPFHVLKTYELNQHSQPVERKWERIPQSNYCGLVAVRKFMNFEIL